MRRTCLAIACLLVSTAGQAQTEPVTIETRPPATQEAMQAAAQRNQARANELASPPRATEPDPSKVIAQLAGEAFMREAQARLQIERLQAQVELQRKRADEAEGALAALRAENAKP